MKKTNCTKETYSLIVSREQRLQEARQMNLLSDAFMSVVLEALLKKLVTDTEKTT